MNLSGKRIHLSVEGGCGGTSFGLHCAVNEIHSGGRVLWASPEMPNATRFSQLFSSLNIVESSRFHAMNLIGAMDRCVDAIVEAERSLPRVGLVVPVSYTHLRAHETGAYLVCRLLLEKKNK